jgi:hypothetical protein
LAGHRNPCRPKHREITIVVEIWLRTNARAVWFGTVLPAAVGVAGLLLATGLPGHEPAAWLRVVGIVLLVLAALTVLALLWQLRRPRLAYADDHLLIGLRFGAPIRVPVEVVECFWLGQAASLLPLDRDRHREASSLVIRIAERAADWRHQEVSPQLGAWCEGYVTIRGTWCEPLSVPLVNRLNQRLSEVSRQAATRNVR